MRHATGTARACAAATAVMLVAAALSARADQAVEHTSRHTVRGLMLEVDPLHSRFLVSHESVPGVMPAMTMAFDIREPKELDGVEAGMLVEFTLVVGAASAYAEGIRIQRYRSAEQDPLTARRLKLLTDVASWRPAPAALSIGQAVPDFTLIDQSNRRVTLSELQGNVVAVNFIYTSCALPQFCFRTASYFGALQRRFRERRDLVLLTVTFDPERDTPEVLSDYANRSLHADTTSWRFLTGALPDVKRVCNLFGVAFFPDEGLMNHSLHTAVIDRRGTLVANIEGNRFTSTQLGDLVDTALRR